MRGRASWLAAMGGWWLCAGMVAAQTPPPAVVLLPPLPAPGQAVTLVVADPAPWSTDARLYLWLGGGPPTLDVRADARATAAYRYPTFAFRVGAPGTYQGEYFDEPFPTYTSNPKAGFSFTVSGAGLATVVEFHHAQPDRYFYTTDPDEIAKLDAGATPGWTRTGESFRALPAGTVASYALPVCRYYGAPGSGIDGHFFSASAAECAAVAAKWPHRWQLETREAFLAFVPPALFTCEPDYWQRVYRLYDDRSGPRHRYTVSRAIRDRMLADGSVEEGARLDGPYEESYAMCVPGDGRG